jgi:ferredoxin
MTRLEFSAPTKRKAYERAKGRCQACDVELRDGGPQYHHILEARLGGDNALANCQVLCIPCHKVVTKEQSIPRITKMKRQHAGSINAHTPSAPIRSPGFARTQRAIDRSKREPKQALPPRQLYAREI